MDLLPVILLCAACTALAAIPYWLFNLWTRSRTEKFMLAAAQKLGLIPSAGDKKNLPTVAGRYRTHSTTIAASYTSNEHHFPLTRITVRLDKPVDFQLRIVDNSFLSSSPDEEYFPFADQVLDKALQLATTDNQKTSLLIDEQIKQDLHKALELGCQRGELVIDEFELRYTDPQHMLLISDFARVTHMVELLHDLADKLDCKNEAN